MTVWIPASKQKASSEARGAQRVLWWQRNVMAQINDQRLRAIFKWMGMSLDYRLIPVEIWEMSELCGHDKAQRWLCVKQRLIV